MAKLKLWLWEPFLVSIICMITASCSNELSMIFPEGPEGPAGKSAYEIWVNGVMDGTIDWPLDQTDVNNFFLFLKGKDGKDGVNGVDGVNGKSAYELWKEEVAKGIDNPHNPGTEWPKDQTDINDFWDYLTGADGKDGSTPKIGENGNWWINGTDTGIPAKGKDGADGRDGRDAVPPVITIGTNGNWYIDGVDTGKPSRGENGADGKDGHTPTITIGENGNWFIDGKDTGKPSKGEDGKDGKCPVVTIGLNGNWYIDGVDTGRPSRGADGADGKDGHTSVITIGDNGNWYIDGEDTGRPSKGADGADGNGGHTPDITIGANGNWYIDGVDTGKPSKGADGQNGHATVVTIGENGNWYIDGVDTGKPSCGENGSDGSNGSKTTVAIGENGNWYIDGEDTGVPARGQDGNNGSDGSNGTNGSNGKDGLSAYDLWVREVNSEAGVYKNGEKWPTNKTSMADFWEFLRGNDGKDGKDGENGTGLEQPDLSKLDKSKAHVIAIYAYPEQREYVDLHDGSVRYQVILQGSVPGDENTVVKLPYVKNPDKEYHCGADGYFIVPAEDLPTEGSNSNRPFGEPSVVHNGVSQPISTLTFVPNRVQVRIRYDADEAHPIPTLVSQTMTVYLKVERKLDPASQWGIIPNIGNAEAYPGMTLYAVDIEGRQVAPFKEAYGFTATTRNPRGYDLTKVGYIPITRLGVSNRDLKLPIGFYLWWPEGELVPGKSFWDEDKLNTWGRSGNSSTKEWSRYEKRYLCWGLGRIYGYDNVMSGAIFQDLPINIPALLRAKDMVLKPTNSWEYARITTTVNYTDGKDDPDPKNRPLDYNLLFKEYKKTKTVSIGGYSMDVFDGVLLSPEEYDALPGIQLSFTNYEGSSSIVVSTHATGVSVNEPSSTTMVFYYPNATLKSSNNLYKQYPYIAANNEVRYHYGQLNVENNNGNITVDFQIPKRVENATNPAYSELGIYDPDNGHPYGFSPDLFGEITVQTDETTSTSKSTNRR